MVHLCPWNTSCDSSTIFHIRTLPSRAPDVTTRSCDRTSMPVILSWWPNLHKNQQQSDTLRYDTTFHKVSHYNSVLYNSANLHWVVWRICSIMQSAVNRNNKYWASIKCCHVYVNRFLHNSHCSQLTQHSLVKTKQLSNYLKSNTKKPIQSQCLISE